MSIQLRHSCTYRGDVGHTQRDHTHALPRGILIYTAAAAAGGDTAVSMCVIRLMQTNAAALIVVSGLPDAAAVARASLT